MQVASRKYVRLDDLTTAVGKRIAAARSIVQAALVDRGLCFGTFARNRRLRMHGRRPVAIRRLPDTTGMKNEVIVQRTHRVNYDHAIRNAGVQMIEVDHA